MFQNVLIQHLLRLFACLGIKGFRGVQSGQRYEWFIKNVCPRR